MKEKLEVMELGVDKAFVPSLDSKAEMIELLTMFKESLVDLEKVVQKSVIFPLYFYSNKKLHI